ncbi:MAG: hypothetical protein U9N83_08145, partial [Thermodesulfobacteriota bacterium]|nr:hypothetical protein [Thermodesulfobacteriota bacterium]
PATPESSQLQPGQGDGGTGYTNLALSEFHLREQIRWQNKFVTSFIFQNHCPVGSDFFAKNERDYEETFSGRQP